MRYDTVLGKQGVVVVRFTETPGQDPWALTARFWLDKQRIGALDI
jgi:hypothetical protein